MDASEAWHWSRDIILTKSCLAEIFNFIQEFASLSLCLPELTSSCQYEGCTGLTTIKLKLKFLLDCCVDFQACMRSSER